MSEANEANVVLEVLRRVKPHARAGEVPEDTISRIILERHDANARIKALVLEMRRRAAALPVISLLAMAVTRALPRDRAVYSISLALLAAIEEARAFVTDTLPRFERPGDLDVDEPDPVANDNATAEAPSAAGEPAQPEAAPTTAADESGEPQAVPHGAGAGAASGAGGIATPEPAGPPIGTDKREP